MGEALQKINKTWTLRNAGLEKSHEKKVCWRLVKYVKTLSGLMRAKINIVVLTQNATFGGSRTRLFTPRKVSRLSATHTSPLQAREQNLPGEVLAIRSGLASSTQGKFGYM